MKYLRYIIISLSLIILHFECQACYLLPNIPADYSIFRLYDEELKDSKSINELNILEWQRYTKGEASYDDIQEVVYKFSIDDMMKVKRKQYNSDNSFIDYLIKNEADDVIDFLILAKKCEERRFRRSDKWWYPTKADLQFADMQEIIDEALSYNGVELRPRYLLQVIRAAFTMGNYELCLQLWSDEIQEYPSSAVKTMCQDYIGGIYFRKKEYKEAIKYYVYNYDQSQSFWWCANNIAELNTELDRIKILYNYFPDSPELFLMVQDICRRAEVDINRKCRDEVKIPEFIELRDFALKVVADRKVKDPAAWQYTASFLTFVLGDSKLASKYLIKAEAMKGSSFTKESIGIFRVMFDAYTANYNTSFEMRMLTHLQWLDNLIVSNLTDEVVERQMNGDVYVFRNIKRYYYYDAMRKIVLSIMVPKYIEYNKPVKALLLTGMVSERLRTITDYREHSQVLEGEEKPWNIDFYTDVFNLMDIVPVDDVIEYAKILNSRNDNSFDSFLARRCYSNADYLNEIIGTKYMREANFKKAVEYLSKVSEDYEATLNISEYFLYDPFTDPFIRKVSTPITKNRKLDFATRMYDIENITKNSLNKEFALESKYQYALGLIRSVNDCWALTGYEKSCCSTLKYKEWQNNLTQKAHQILNEVQSASSINETVAKCLALKLSYAYRWGDSRDTKLKYGVLTDSLSKYSETNIWENLSKSCDTFTEYLEKGKLFGID